MPLQEHLAGHPEYRITRRDAEATHLQYIGARPDCTSCKQPLSRVGNVIREVYDVPWGDRPQYLKVTLPRWRCPNGCPAPRGLPGLTAPTEGPARQKNLTERLVAYLEDAWGRGEAVTVLARQTGLREDRLYTLVHARAPHLHRHWRSQEMLRGLQFIGIDDLFWRQQPMVVVMNIAPGLRGRGRALNTAGRVIDILPTREFEVVVTFLRGLKEAKARLGEPDWHPVIATDMWQDFRVAIIDAFQGQAIHVADRFHIAAKIVEDLQETLTQLLTNDLQAARGSAAVGRASQLDIRQRTERLRRSYLAALRDGGAATLPDDLPRPLSEQVAELIRLACVLHGLWDVKAEDPDDRYRCAQAYYSEWARDVGAFDAGAGVTAFRRLRHLFEVQGWLVQVLNALRPEARLPVEALKDAARAHAPQARPPAGQLASTARVEATNRVIRKLEERSPNHRRVPSKSTDWRGWKEEELFGRYRARLLYALNTPARARPVHDVVVSVEPGVCACGADPDQWIVMDGPPATAWDVPLADAQVRLHWRRRTARCRQCGAQESLSVPANGRITLRLLAYLRGALASGDTILALYRRTGASRATLKSLRSTLPEPVCVPPADLGVLTFLWRGTLRLALFDVERGCPTELLDDVEQGTLLQWLEQPRARSVQRVWVERVQQLPQTRTPGVQWVLDPFAAARIFQQSVQALQRSVTAPMPVSRLRAPPNQRLRRVLTSNPQARRLPLDTRLDEARLTALRQRYAASHPAVDRGLSFISALKETLGHTATEDALDTWLAEVDAFHHAGRDDSGVRQVMTALELSLRHLRPGALARPAILEGYRASPRPKPTREDVEDIMGPGLPRRLNLALSRRRLNDLKSLPIYRGTDWTHLRTVALTRIGR